jgi:hypothetical protein
MDDLGRAMTEILTSPCARPPERRATGRPTGLMCLAVAALAIAAVGCSAAPGHSAGATSGPGLTSSPAVTTIAGKPCGTARTGANVPVIITIVRGTVDCGTALRVEKDYAALIDRGGLHGNGGGAPASVNGWTCQGYPTPQVLRTGETSQCHTATAEIVAVLQLPAPGASASPAR